MRRPTNVFLAFLILVLVVTPIQAAAQAQGPVYIVQEGDSLWGIAQKFGTDVAALAAANGMTPQDALNVGKELLIPGFEGVSGVLTTREVAFGETLDSLSLRYGIDQASLSRLNRVVNPARLFAGQDLIVPESSAGSSSLAESTRTLVRQGETDLELAMRRGVTPWAMRIYSERGFRLWSVPGETAITPQSGHPSSGLIDLVTEARVTPLPAVQGHTTEVDLALAAPVTPEGSFGSWPLHFEARDASHWVALQGVYAMLPPGMIEVTLTIPAEGDRPAFEFAQPVYVASGGYGYDPILTVPPETIDPEKTQPENDQVASVVAPVTPEKLWDGPFQFPSTLTKSFPSRFGSRRNYNGTGYVYYHSGLDFYGASGTPITAPARGRVVFTEALTVRGKTTIIDHGWGIYTAYLHQSEFLVKPGDMVEAGQTIGLIGATGRVTGPHLHWEVWVNGVPVDPLEWVGAAFPAAESTGP